MPCDRNPHQLTWLLHLPYPVGFPHYLVTSIPTLTSMFIMLDCVQYYRLLHCRAQEYWSGYYTSRPFTKHVDRVLEGTLRAAEILLSLTLARNLPMAGHAEVLLDMQKARRELALFQHHDGVTGTAREAVVKDYIDRLMRGVAISQRVISAATQALLLGTRAGEAREVMLEVVSVCLSDVIFYLCLRLLCTTCMLMYSTSPPPPPPSLPSPPPPCLGPSLSQPQ